MLTKNDLSAIGQVVEERIDKRFTEQEEKTDRRFTSLEKNLKGIKRDLQTVQKDVRVMLAVLDRADVELRRRVERIEAHLGFTNQRQ